MRILYLCHRIPYPPDKGEKIRAFHQLRQLSARHSVDVFTLAHDAADLGSRSPLAQYCDSLTVARINPRLARLRSLPFLLTKGPLTIPYFYSAELQRKVRAALAARSYDRILVYCSAMAQYVESPGSIPVITDFVDVDSDKWRQYGTFTNWPFAAVYRREARTLQVYERGVCERSACVVVTTEREARLVRQISGSVSVQAIPNGVDSEYFRPAAGLPDPAFPTIGFVGEMSYFPNEQAVTYFAADVLPRIRQSAPAARFLIVGRNPSPRVRKLAAIEGVEVTGGVPDVRPYLARMQVTVAPFAIAAGIQNKILESLACGVPVVATSRAVQGLSPGAAQAVGVADTPETMAAAIVELLRHPEVARSRGMEGRRRVTAEYNWERSFDRLLEIVEEPGRFTAPAKAAQSVLS